MEARSAASPAFDAPLVRSTVEVSATPDAVTESPGGDARPEVQTSVATGRRSTRARARTIERPIPLSRADEYRFIRSDLTRLLITASLLGLTMLVLLIVLEA